MKPPAPAITIRSFLAGMLLTALSLGGRDFVQNAAGIASASEPN
jgi:hypothetical protein